MTPRLKNGLFVTLIFLCGWFSSQALAGQPHMQAALAALGTAENQLVKAAPDKGGHRAKALALVRQAKIQVKAGIAYDAIR